MRSSFDFQLIVRQYTAGCSIIQRNGVNILTKVVFSNIGYFIIQFIQQFYSFSMPFKKYAFFRHTK